VLSKNLSKRFGKMSLGKVKTEQEVLSTYFHNEYCITDMLWIVYALEGICSVVLQV